MKEKIRAGIIGLGVGEAHIEGYNGQLTSNFGCVFPHFHELDLYGTNATFVNEFKRAKMYHNRDSKDFKFLNTAYPGVNKGDLLYNFVESIINDNQPRVNKKDVFNTMSVCFAIERSLNTKKLEKVNYLL